MKNVHEVYTLLTKKIVVDSSALILLAKCGLMGIMCELFEVKVPSSVMAEVASKEMITRYPDAALIKDLTSKRKIMIQDHKGAGFQLPLSLHKGERDAILLAMETGNSILATDDGKAIKAARFLKIPFIISPKIVIELYKLQKISFKFARESIEKLNTIGRYSPDIIARAFVSLMEGENDKTYNHKVT